MPCEGLADESRTNPFGVLAVVALDLQPEERAALRRVLDLIRSRREGGSASSRESPAAFWEMMDAAAE